MVFTVHHQNNPAASFDSLWWEHCHPQHSIISNWLACDLLLFHGDFTFSTSEHWKKLPACEIIPYMNLMLVVWNQLVNSGRGGMPPIKVWFTWCFISHLEGQQRFWEQGDAFTVCFKIVVFCAYQLSLLQTHFTILAEKKKRIKMEF